MDPSSFLPIISGFLGGAASAGVFKGPIQTVEDWWYISFGQQMNEQAEKLRVKQQIDIDLFKNDLLQEASKINPNNVQEPQLKILGPSLEASKYYIEEEALRSMFAKLIASSMDSSKESIVHSSFVEIIKQLTPLDAENLLSIYKMGSRNTVCKLRINYSTGGFETRYKNIYIGNPNVIDQSAIGPSLDNLVRLGLVVITYDEYSIKEAAYDSFYKISEYTILEEELLSKNKHYDNLKLMSENNPEIDISKIPTLSGPEMIKGLIDITPFGKNFCATCL